MKANKQIAKRMQEMLLKDKMNVKDGFLAMLDNDVNHLFNDYFEMKETIKTHVSQNEKGEYVIKVEGCASRIKTFDTTVDYYRS